MIFLVSSIDKIIFLSGALFLLSIVETVKQGKETIEPFYKEENEPTG